MAVMLMEVLIAVEKGSTVWIDLHVLSAGLLE
jgi:hypothetical protein